MVTLQWSLSLFARADVHVTNGAAVRFFGQELLVMSGNRPKPGLVHCLVDRGLDRLAVSELEGELSERGIDVIVDRRTAPRRARGERRSSPARPAAGACRRRIRNTDGRRVADRRADARAWMAGAALARDLRERYGPVRLVQPALEDESEMAETLRLVVRFQAGDEAAFRELYERFFASIYRFFSSALADRHSAEDQSQELFVRVFRALPSYEIRGLPFEAWLFRIARNQVIDERERREALLVEEPTRVVRRQQVVEQRSVREPATFRDRDLLECVQRLPLAQRQVIVLRYVVDLDWKTIALALDKSPGAVRQLEQRAFSALRRRVEGFGEVPSVQRLPYARRQTGSPVAARRRSALAA